MSYKTLILLWITILSTLVSSCGDKKNTPSPENNLRCFSGEILKSVKGQQGKVQYNSFENSYAIYVSIPGTYDSVDAGFICDQLDSLKKDGLSITFSGNYHAYKTGVKPPIGGLEYYYLDLTNYKISEE